MYLEFRRQIMKKITAIMLILLMTFALCACRMGGNSNNTPETEGTTPPVTTNPVATDPVADPTVMDPTMETNIPDPNVDNDHLVDPTGDGAVGDAARNITRRINGMS